MKRLGGIIVATLFGSSVASAQEVIGTVKPTAAGIKTTYSISGDNTTITSVAANNNNWDKAMMGYIFPLFKRSLEGMAFISSVMQSSGVETTESNTWWDYDLKKRKSHAFLNLSLQTPLTLLFEIEETYRKCKPPKTQTVTSEDGYYMACSKQATITIKGPVAVYGNYATSINADSLLRNKQDLEVTLSKSYNDEDTNLVTRFSVRTVSFDDGLARFFRLFNIPVFVGHGGDVGYGNGLLDKVSPLTSRQRLMLGISRIARNANERMLGL